MKPLEFDREPPPIVTLPYTLAMTVNGPAIAIYSYLAVRPYDWMPRRADLMAVVGGSRAKYKEGVDLLRAIGCLTTTARRGHDGVIRRALSFDPMIVDMVSGKVAPHGAGQKPKQNSDVQEFDNPSNGAIVQDSCNTSNHAIVQTSCTTITPVIEIYTDTRDAPEIPDDCAEEFEDDPQLTDDDVWGPPDVESISEYFDELWDAYHDATEAAHEPQGGDCSANPSSPTGAVSEAPQNALQPNLIEAQAFLDCFPGAITFQVFDDTKVNPKLARILSGPLSQHADTLADLNEQGGGVYFAVNEQAGDGRNAGSTKHVRALFADLDGAPLRPVRDFFIKPHLIVESSPGKYHAYWLVRNCPLAAFREAQKAIARRFGSDPKVHDLPRVLRVPGFQHRKGEPFQVRVIEQSEHEPYQFQRLAKAFKPEPKQEQPTYSGTTDQASRDWSARGVAEGARNSTLFKRACAARAKGKSFSQILSELLADNAVCSPPLPPAEIQIIVQQSMKYAGGAA